MHQFEDKIVDRLRELSDLDYQRRVWAHGSTDEMSSYDEAICGLFDDTGLARSLDGPLAQCVFRVDIDFQLRKLAKLTSEFSDVESMMSPIEAIDHPQMQEIRAKAAMILSELLKLRRDK
jgi:hypothetical protein